MLGVGRAGPRGRDAADSAPGGPPAAGVPWTDSSERDAWVVLNEVDGVGPVSFARLLEAFGTAVAVLRTATAPGGTGRLVEATARFDAPPSLTPAAARAIATCAADPEPVLGSVRRAGVRALLLVDHDFPARLRTIQLPPPVLYVRGNVASMDRPRAVAIVGTRRPTEAGRATASRIAEGVASLGATVVSGLALGVDAAAHASALRVGAPTVAVIGGGHDRLYPAGHRALVDRIVAEGGAVVSEFTPPTVPSRGTFPRRNRIISGLADATIVVEAGARSGALTTAAWAVEQSRGLFIVPGRLDDPAVAGSLAFLREAGPEARVVAGIPELIEDLGLVGSTSRAAGPGPTGPAQNDEADGGSVSSRARYTLASLPPVERAIMQAILDGRSGVDELVATTGLGGATVLGALTALEVRGLVVETFGRYRVAGPLATGGRRVHVPSVRPSGRQRVAAGLGDGSSQQP